MQAPANNQNERREEETETEPSVVSRSRRTVIEDIPYSTSQVEISSQEKGTQRVYKPGSKGTREIIYETVKYSDGSTETRTVSDIKTDPTNEVIYIGTREPEQPDSEEEIEGNQGE